MPWECEKCGDKQHGRKPRICPKCFKKYKRVKDIDDMVITRYLNSPQFKKQYAKLPEDGKNPYHCYICQPVVGTERQMAELDQNELHACNRKAYAEGQQNPDPKQYANKEELVEEFERRFRDKPTVTSIVRLNEAQEIILKHGLEEEPILNPHHINKILKETQDIINHGLEE